MAKPNWTPRLSDVLGHKIQETTKVSAQTGKEYKTDVILVLNVLSTGLVKNMGDGKYRYSIVDRQKDLECAIKVPAKIDIKFGNTLIFTNVCGGTTNFGGWYSAVSTIQRNV